MIDNEIVEWYVEILENMDPHSPCIDCKEFDQTIQYMSCNKDIKYYMPISTEVDSIADIEDLYRIYYVLELKLHYLVKILGQCKFHENLAYYGKYFHHNENILEFLPINTIGVCI